MTRIVYRDGVVIPEHSHEAEQIMLVESGPAVGEGRGRGVARSGRARCSIIPSNWIHAFRQLGDEDVVFYECFAPIRLEYLVGFKGPDPSLGDDAHGVRRDRRGRPQGLGDGAQRGSLRLVSRSDLAPTSTRPARRTGPIIRTTTARTRTTSTPRTTTTSKAGTARARPATGTRTRRGGSPGWSRRSSGTATTRATPSTMRWRGTAAGSARSRSRSSCSVSRPLLQLAIVAVSGSVALLADTVHNF